MEHFAKNKVHRISKDSKDILDDLVIEIKP